MLVTVLGVGCGGPYKDYAGTYTKSTNDYKITFTLSSSGEFELRREWSNSNINKGGPLDSDVYNVRKGTFTVDDNGTIHFSYTYYEPALGANQKGSATAKLSNNKLTVTDANSMGIGGVFNKK